VDRLLNNVGKGSWGRERRRRGGGGRAGHGDRSVAIHFATILAIVRIIRSEVDAISCRGVNAGFGRKLLDFGRESSDVIIHGAEGVGKDNVLSSDVVDVISGIQDVLVGAGNVVDFL